jgi:hypothetical protein
VGCIKYYVGLAFCELVLECNYSQLHCVLNPDVVSFAFDIHWHTKVPSPILSKSPAVMKQDVCFPVWGRTFAGTVITDGSKQLIIITHMCRFVNKHQCSRECDAVWFGREVCNVLEKHHP